MYRNLARAIVSLTAVALISSWADRADAQQTKVACIGDSITALPSSWCGDLSTKLGSGYTVTNFGVSGTNLAKNVAQPYWTSAEYTPSHTFAPNIVIIMLGTNDAIPNTWNGGKAHFEKDYEDLIDTYTSLATMPRVYIILPTPIGTSPFGHDGNLLATEVIPLIKQVAMAKMVPTIDAFTAFGGTSFDPGLYGTMDQVHPNAKGQQIICDGVYAVLMSSGGPGNAGSGGTAGGGGSANAGNGGAVGIAGSSANAGGSAHAGAGGMTMIGGSAGAAVGGSTNASGAGGARANAAGSGNAGSPANVGGNPSLTGVAGFAIGGSNSSGVNSIGAAGMSAPVVSAPKSSGGGCRVTGNSTNDGGLTGALLLLVGLVIRSRKRNQRARDPLRFRSDSTFT